MPAETYDIIIDQGATFELNLVWKQSNGTPVDLDGYTAQSHLRRTYVDEDPILQFTVVLGDDGQITLSATATQTAALPARRSGWKGVWDLELTQSGVVTRLIGGSATVRPEATR